MTLGLGVMVVTAGLLGVASKGWWVSERMEGRQKEDVGTASHPGGCPCKEDLRIG